MEHFHNDLFDSMSKDHDQTRLGHHVVGHHEVVARQYDDRLFSGYSFAVVSVVMPPIVLACLQRRQPGRPVALVAVFN